LGFGVVGFGGSCFAFVGCSRCGWCDVCFGWLFFGLGLWCFFFVEQSFYYMRYMNILTKDMNRMSGMKPSGLLKEHVLRNDVSIFNIRRERRVK